VSSFLLDTHIWRWLQTTPERLPDEVRELLADPANTLLLSAARSWEIAIKYRLGKTSAPAAFGRVRAGPDATVGAASLPIEHMHALRVADLPDHHNDPFDRLIVAQAQELRIPVVTADGQLSAYSVHIVPV
jgi:PIN domain nuclease of toxin-antitoxin system